MRWWLRLLFAVLLVQSGSRALPRRNEHRPASDCLTVSAVELQSEQQQTTATLVSGAARQSLFCASRMRFFFFFNKVVDVSKLSPLARSLLHLQ